MFGYGYNNDNRLIQASLGGVTQASYTLNYLGQRAIKAAVQTGTTHFHYDRASHLIAESDGSGNLLDEYVWLGDMPLAFVTPTRIDFIHADHLGTPQKMTDANQNLVWDGGASDPFMMSALPTTPAMGLRFPGQYFDAETAHHYNYFRDYDPSLGRYVESDPIGLGGGVNTYGYADGNPRSNVDRFGLCLEDACIGEGILIGALIDEVVVPAVTATLTALDADLITQGEITDPQLSSSDDSSDGGHTKDARPSTEQKHQDGDARRKKDQGHEKADEERRPHRKKPKGWKGPWPPPTMKVIEPPKPSEPEEDCP